MERKWEWNEKDMKEEDRGDRNWIEGHMGR